MGWRAIRSPGRSSTCCARGPWQGAEREYWKDEHADIIPELHECVAQGHADEYERIKKERSKGKDGEEVSAVQTLTREDLDMEARNRVWKKAMDASWGKIDLDEFERRRLVMPTL
ncbi:MAG: hypothetical protein R3F17_16770 [Planctomycetota bacterium]